MEREKAVKISHALVAVEDFERFIEIVEDDILDAEIIDFHKPLMDFLNAELERRKKVLEAL